MAPSLPSSPAQPSGLLDAFSFRRSLLGFFLSGIVLSFLGAMLPVWGHHLRGEFRMVAFYFAALAVGMIGSLYLTRFWLGPKPTRVLLVTGSFTTAAGFLALASVPLSAAGWWRLAGLLLAGVGGGLLNVGSIRALFPTFQYSQWASVNMAGAAHSFGCFLTAWFVHNTLYSYTNFAIFFFLAMAPVFLGVLFQQSRFPVQPPVRTSFRDTWLQFRSPTSVLFVGLVVLQFANEYTVAGWLPLYLIQRLGMSPDWAILLLAVFWGVLLLGRVLAQALMRFVAHERLFFGAAGGSFLGCLILLSTNNVFGATAGILFMGGSFAVIYPLVVEKIEGRFPAHHPELLQNIMISSLALGLAGPAVAGAVVAVWDIQAAMLLPLIGMILVFLLVLAIWLEAKLTAPPVVIEAGK